MGDAKCVREQALNVQGDTGPQVDELSSLMQAVKTNQGCIVFKAKL